MKKLIVRWKEEYCNLPVTKIERIGDVVEAYRGEEFVGLFDLGAVDAIYITGTDQER